MGIYMTKTKLSECEATAVRLLAEGVSKLQIATNMKVRLTTVIGYIGSARRKMNCESEFSMILKIKASKGQSGGQE